jgi:hypothetical protein
MRKKWQNKSEKEGMKQIAINKQIKKKKDSKIIVKKRKGVRKNLDKKTIKEKELKIKILTHE